MPSSRGSSPGSPPGSWRRPRWRQGSRPPPQTRGHARFVALAEVHDGVDLDQRAARSEATPIAARAGRLVEIAAITSFTLAKLPRSVRYTVTRATRSKSPPASRHTAAGCRTRGGSGPRCRPRRSSSSSIERDLPAGTPCRRRYRLRVGADGGGASGVVIERIGFQCHELTHLVVGTRYRFTVFFDSEMRTTSGCAAGRKTARGACGSSPGS